MIVFVAAFCQAGCKAEALSDPMRGVLDSLGIHSAIQRISTYPALEKEGYCKYGSIAADSLQIHESLSQCGTG